MISCKGCEKPILDKFLLNVLDQTWHASCVRCVECHCILTEKCFSREEKLFCRDDFFRRYGTKCTECHQGISPNDLVRRAQNRVFHVKCFRCIICGRQLSTGQQLYMTEDNKCICIEDYNSRLWNRRGSEGSSLSSEEEFEDDGFNKQSDSLVEKTFGQNNVNADLDKGDIFINDDSSGPCSSPFFQNGSVKNDDQCLSENKSESSGLNDDHKENDSIGKRRGPRTTIKAKQLEVLKAAFVSTPKPTRHIREQLAKDTGLNMRVIQVWFQNRRSKERRMKQLSNFNARKNFYRHPRRQIRLLSFDMNNNFVQNTFYSGKHSSTVGNLCLLALDEFRADGFSNLNPPIYENYLRTQSPSFNVHPTGKSEIDFSEFLFLNGRESAATVSPFQQLHATKRCHDTRCEGRSRTSVWSVPTGAENFFMVA